MSRASLLTAVVIFRSDFYRLVEVAIVENPHGGAGVRRERDFTSKTEKLLSPNNSSNTLRFEEPFHKVSFGRVPGNKHLLHRLVSCSPPDVGIKRHTLVLSASRERRHRRRVGNISAFSEQTRHAWRDATRPAERERPRDRRHPVLPFSPEDSNAVSAGYVSGGHDPLTLALSRHGRGNIRIRRVRLRGDGQSHAGVPSACAGRRSPSSLSRFRTTLRERIRAGLPSAPTAAST